MFPSRFGPSCKPCKRSGAGPDLHRRASLRCPSFSFSVGYAAFAAALGSIFARWGMCRALLMTAVCEAGYGNESAHSVSRACIQLECPLGGLCPASEIRQPLPEEFFTAARFLVPSVPFTWD